MRRENNSLCNYTYRPGIFLAGKRILEGYMCKILLHREVDVAKLFFHIHLKNIHIGEVSCNLVLHEFEQCITATPMVKAKLHIFV